MIKRLMFVFVVVVSTSIMADVVSYTAGSDKVRFNDMKQLSDGTVLVAGEASGLNWVPAGATTQLIDASGINSAATGQIAFIARFNNDMTDIMQLIHFTAGSIRDVYRIRSTEVPGQATGQLFISGSRDLSSWLGSGYYLAKLNNNFMDGLPTALEWSYDVVAEPREASGRQGESAYKTMQPWDVNANGEIIFGRGAEYDYGWAIIHKLNAQGQLSVVEHWPAHWQPSAGECYSAASACSQTPTHSGVVLKAGRIGSLRSRTADAYNLQNVDGNGHARQGAYPDDYYFNSHCAPGDCQSNGPGYTGYRKSGKPTQRMGGISIDRRSGHFYFGYSTQSVLPGGNPDFEPAVVAMDQEGRMKWWQRLYRETDQNSPPDQYIDAIALDYANDKVVVLARTHGNAVDNFFNGNDISAQPEAQGFQNRFTGTSGNIHVSWLGKLTLDSGQYYASSYVAEYQNGGSGTGAMLTDPNLNLFPNPNAAWPDLNTTRCQQRLHIGLFGEVVVACTGRRIITTNDAQHAMYPLNDGESKWSQFVRVYASDLSTVYYSTLVTGLWDGTSANDPNNTQVYGTWLYGNQLSVSGFHIAENGVAIGQSINVENVPSLGVEEPSDETALWGRYTIHNPSGQFDLIFVSGFE